MSVFQVGFDAVTGPELKKSLNAIPTTFRLEKEEMKAIEDGVEDLFAPNAGEVSDCVRRLGEFLTMPGAGQWSGEIRGAASLVPASSKSRKISGRPADRARSVPAC